MVRRPLGIGLGTIPKLPSETVLTNCTNVRVSGDLYGEDVYGQIEGLDENNGRAIVRMTISGEVQTISELFLTPDSANKSGKENKPGQISLIKKG